jgi:hypothetical protein
MGCGVIYTQRAGFSDQSPDVANSRSDAVGGLEAACRQQRADRPMPAGPPERKLLCIGQLCGCGSKQPKIEIFLDTEEKEFLWQHGLLHSSTVDDWKQADAC